jgi:phthiocerol/phenolphthiocerol synthesis type-I polyketide synthase E
LNAAVSETLSARGLEVQRLRASRAFHSAMLQPMVPALGQAVAALSPPARSLAVPWASSLTGEWLTSEVAGTPGYWMREAREPVQFRGTLAQVLRDPAVVVLEVGPSGLGSLVRAQGGASRFVPTLDASAERPEDLQVAEALARLWVAGCDIDRAAPYRGEQRRRLPVPGYPFDRERHWVEAATAPGERPGASPAHPAPAPRAASAPDEASELTPSIVALWQELLGGTLGPDDNVYAHGATSLNAVQMGVRLAELLPVRIPVKTILASTTPAELARNVESLLIEALERMPEGETPENGRVP